MKVAIIALGDVTKQVDGIATFHKNIMEQAQHDDSIHIDYIVATKDRPQTYPKKNIRIHKIHLPNRLNIYPGLYISKNPLAYAHLVKLFKELYIKYQYDVIQISSPDPFCAAALYAASQLDIPVVGMYHTMIPEYAKYWAKQRKGFVATSAPQFQKIILAWTKYIYQKCDVVAAPNAFTAKTLESWDIPKKNIYIVSRGITPKKFEKTPSKKVNILHVGRLAPEKNILDLEGIDTIPNAHTTIVGDGTSTDQLKALLPHAQFTGFLKGKDLSKQYQQADIFVFPSKTDTFANVILEAMSYGLPIVGYDNTTITDRVSHDENGLLAKNKDELIKQVATLVENKSFRENLGKQSRQKAKLYTWSAVYQQQRQLLQEAINAQHKIL